MPEGIGDHTMSRGHASDLTGCPARGYLQSCNMRFGGTTKVLAKRVHDHQRISWRAAAGEVRRG